MTEDYTLSENEDCRRLKQSTCEGFNFGSAPCGSVCEAYPVTTGMRKDEIVADTIEVDFYSADFWCADYDVDFGGGLVISYTCAGICLDENPVGTTVREVTDCILTDEGCLLGYHEL